MREKEREREKDLKKCLRKAEWKQQGNENIIEIRKVENI